MEVHQVSIDKLIPYCNNPRKNDHAIEQMVASIQEFGFRIPVLARSNGELIDGHLRLKAARKLGMTEIPVILCDESTPSQVKGFRIIVNPSSTWADWDEELLAVEIEELRVADFALTLTGSDENELEQYLQVESCDEDE